MACSSNDFCWGLFTCKLVTCKQFVYATSTVADAIPLDRVTYSAMTIDHRH